MSVADRGRGGFDSHTFPPAVPGRGRLAGLVLAALLAAGSPGAAGRAAAAVAAPDTTLGEAADVGAEIDTAIVLAPPPVTGAPARNARGELVRPWHRAPWAIMTRSALVPGWGQWTNGRPWKALLATGAEVAGGSRLARAMSDTDDALARERAALAAGDDAAAAIARSDYEAAYNRRSTWAWIVGTTIALSMLDAYVDAHLLQFDADFGPDPKLFDDDDAARGRTTGGTTDLRVGLRFTFQGPAGR